MSIAEQIAILTCKGVQPDYVPGGKPTLTADDISGAMGMAGLSRVQYLLLRAKFCGDNTVLRELYDMAYVEIAGLVARRKWTIVRGRPYYQAMTVMAVGEVLYAHTCPKCKGTKFIEARPCPRCKASGVEPMRGGTAIAEIMEMPRSTWYSTWAPRYDDILTEVRHWLADGLQRIKYRMGRD